PPPLSRPRAVVRAALALSALPVALLAAALVAAPGRAALAALAVALRVAFAARSGAVAGARPLLPALGGGGLLLLEQHRVERRERPVELVVEPLTFLVGRL